MVLKPGDQAPEFTLKNSNGKTRTLKDFFGKRLLVYFYPRDYTPSCIVQACSLKKGFLKLAERGVYTIGVSPDTPAQHRRFQSHFNLPFELLSDLGCKMAKAYGVYQQKNLMGLKICWPKRTSFLIEDGVITHTIINVRIASHADQILEIINAKDRVGPADCMVEGADLDESVELKQVAMEIKKNGTVARASKKVTKSPRKKSPSKKVSSKKSGSNSSKRKSSKKKATKTKSTKKKSAKTNSKKKSVKKRAQK